MAGDFERQQHEMSQQLTQALEENSRLCIGSSESRFVLYFEPFLS